MSGSKLSKEQMEILSIDPLTAMQNLMEKYKNCNEEDGLRPEDASNIAL